MTSYGQFRHASNKDRLQRSANPTFDDLLMRECACLSREQQLPPDRRRTSDYRVVGRAATDHSSCAHDDELGLAIRWLKSAFANHSIYVRLVNNSRRTFERTCGHRPESKPADMRQISHTAGLYLRDSTRMHELGQEPKPN